jgi:hypothetical protein
MVGDWWIVVAVRLVFWVYSSPSWSSGATHARCHYLLDFERDVLCTHVSLKLSRARLQTMLNDFDKGWLDSKAIYRAQVAFRES